MEWTIADFHAHHLGDGARDTSHIHLDSRYLMRMTMECEEVSGESEF
jgi:hypothetical protein